MNFWEFLSQPVGGTERDNKIFWDGVAKRKKASKKEIHKHLHINEKELEEIKQLEKEDIETIDL